MNLRKRVVVILAGVMVVSCGIQVSGQAKTSKKIGAVTHVKVTAHHVKGHTVKRAKVKIINSKKIVLSRGKSNKKGNFNLKTKKSLKHKSIKIIITKKGFKSKTLKVKNQKVIIPKRRSSLTKATSTSQGTKTEIDTSKIQSTTSTSKSSATSSKVTNTSQSSSSNKVPDATSDQTVTSSNSSSSQSGSSSVPEYGIPGSNYVFETFSPLASGFMGEAECETNYTEPKGKSSVFYSFVVDKANARGIDTSALQKASQDFEDYRSLIINLWDTNHIDTQRATMNRLLDNYFRQLKIVADQVPGNINAEIKAEGYDSMFWDINYKGGTL